MTFPTIDSRDFVTNPETSRPPETPQKVWVVYYQGDSGQWIWSYPTFYYENALKQVTALNRPSRILEYALMSDVPWQDVVAKTVKTVKVVKKIRKVAD